MQKKGVLRRKKEEEKKEGKKGKIKLPSRQTAPAATAESFMRWSDIAVLEGELNLMPMKSGWSRCICTFSKAHTHARSAAAATTTRKAILIKNVVFELQTGDLTTTQNPLLKFKRFSSDLNFFRLKSVCAMVPILDGVYFPVNVSSNIRV